MIAYIQVGIVYQYRSNTMQSAQQGIIGLIILTFAMIGKIQILRDTSLTLRQRTVHFLTIGPVLALFFCVALLVSTVDDPYLWAQTHDSLLKWSICLCLLTTGITLTVFATDEAEVEFRYRSWLDREYGLSHRWWKRIMVPLTRLAGLIALAGSVGVWWIPA